MTKLNGHETEKKGGKQMQTVGINWMRQCAIEAVEKVLPVFQKEWPDIKEPTEAIEMAKRCIENPSKTNKRRAIQAADIVEDMITVDMSSAARSVAYAVAYASRCAAASSKSHAADAGRIIFTKRPDVMVFYHKVLYYTKLTRLYQDYQACTAEYADRI